MRTRAKRIPKAAMGNSRLADFAELREVVLYHAKAVEQLPMGGLKQSIGDQTLHRYGA